MSPRQYGAALMQAYLGEASLKWVAAVAGIPLKTLHRWRQEPEFLLLMDWSKSLFSESFRENLTLTDYSISQYHEIAGEFSLLEDSLRIAVRTQLYRVLRNLGESLISRHRAGITLEKQDLTLFRRLFLFFFILEHYWPSPARNRLQEQFMPLAKDVVWPRLGLAPWLETELTSAQDKYSVPQIVHLLAEQLKETFHPIS